MSTYFISLLLISNAVVTPWYGKGPQWWEAKILKRRHEGDYDVNSPITFHVNFSIVSFQYWTFSKFIRSGINESATTEWGNIPRKMLWLNCSKWHKSCIVLRWRSTKMVKRLYRIIHFQSIALSSKYIFYIWIPSWPD